LRISNRKLGGQGPAWVARFDAVSVYMNVTVGTKLSGNLVLQKMGKGGMGSVYKVKDETTGAIKAMKILNADLSKDSDVRDRFLQEIRITACLGDHPEHCAPPLSPDD
jgi:hypothetical protein